MKTRQHTRMQKAMRTKIQDLDDRTFNEIASKLNTVHSDGDVKDTLNYECKNSHPVGSKTTAYNEVCDKIPRLSLEKPAQYTRTGNGNAKQNSKTCHDDNKNQGSKTDSGDTISRINNQVIGSNFLEFDKHPVKRRNRTVKFNPKTKIFKCTNRSCHMNFTSYDELSRHIESCRCLTDNTGTTSDCSSMKSVTTLDCNTDTDRNEFHIEKKGKSGNSTECNTGKSGHSFDCKECGQKFWSEHHFRVHNNTHHSAAVSFISCSVCNEKLCSNLELIVHMKQHKDMGRLKCEFCEKKFHSSVHLKDHMTIHATDSPYRCEVCKMRFSSVTELESHVANHDKDIKDAHIQIDSGILCPLCRKDFPSKKEFDLHILTHIGVYPYKCNICDAGFNREEHLQLHMESVHKSVPENCSGNDVPKYDISNSFTAHKSMKRYKCHVCGYKLFDSRSFKKHLKVHKKHRRSKQIRHRHFKEWQEHYRRRLSGVSSSSSSSQSDASSGESSSEEACLKPSASRLFVKRIRHKFEQSFDCPFCNQSFRKYKYLKKHLLTHSIAEKVNASNSRHDSSLLRKENVERRVLLDKKNFKTTTAEICGSCVACGINFTDFQDLELHLLTFHSNGTEKFADSDQPRINKIPHERDAISEKSAPLRAKDTVYYQCDICDMKFNTDEELKYHISSHFENKHVAIDVSNEINKRMSKNASDDIVDNDFMPLSGNTNDKTYHNNVTLKRKNRELTDSMYEKTKKLVKFEPGSLKKGEIEMLSGEKGVRKGHNHMHSDSCEIDSVHSPKETNNTAFSPRGKFMSDTDSGFSEKTNVVSDVESVYSPLGIDVNAFHIDKPSSVPTIVHTHSIQGIDRSESLNVQNNVITLTKEQDAYQKHCLDAVPVTFSSQFHSSLPPQNTIAQSHRDTFELKSRVPFLFNARRKKAEAQQKSGVHFHLLGRLK